MFFGAAQNIGVLEIASLTIRMGIANQWHQGCRTHGGESHLEELANGASHLRLMFDEAITTTK